MMTSDAESSLRAPLDRLYEQEREERNERRGLEQRAATTVAASLVGLGLTLNALGTSKVDTWSGPGLTMMLGGFATIGSLIILSAALAGAHTNDDVSFRQAFRHGRRIRVEREPHPLTEDYVEARRAVVEELREGNATMVPLLRMASWGLGVGVYLALFGAGWALLA